VTESLSPSFPYLAGGCVLLVLLAHVAVRWRIPYADPVILPCVVLLNGLGLVMIHRIDMINDPPSFGARQQLIWTVLGIVLFLLVTTVLHDHRPLQRFTYTIGLVGIVLLLLPLVPGLGTAKFGAQIWISIGSYSFQPAEAAKILLAIAFASYLVEKRDVLALAGYRLLGLDLPRARDLGPILAMWLLSLAILVLQRDLGTSLLFFGLFVMMLYVATQRGGWVLLGTVLFAAGAYFGYQRFGHVRVRVGAWLDPFSDYDAYYQVINAQFGMAWGGLLGTGLGLGRPGLTPLARSDFIAAAIGEELGMTGLMAVILVYGLVVARGLRTALQCREPFGKLLAAGLSFAFALQVFTIIGGVTRLLPLTGLTTPFLSQGGSSLVSNWIIAGLLLVISHHVRKPIVTVGDFGSDQTTELIKVAA
jgi:cell division protein FtsW (lipid II flippase)